MCIGMAVNGDDKSKACALPGRTLRITASCIQQELRTSIKTMSTRVDIVLTRSAVGGIVVGGRVGTAVGHVVGHVTDDSGVSGV